MYDFYKLQKKNLFKVKNLTCVKRAVTFYVIKAFNKSVILSDINSE